MNAVTHGDSLLRASQLAGLSLQASRRPFTGTIILSAPPWTSSLLKSLIRIDSISYAHERNAISRAKGYKIAESLKAS